MHNKSTRKRVGPALAGTPLLIVLMAAGCGTVHPEADFRHTAGLIEERTGIDDVYDPAAEAAVQERVASLLEGGLTPDEAVRVAMLNNRAFQAQFYGIGASRADVVQSGLLSNPTLSLSVRFPEGGGRSNLGFGLAQELVDLWQIPVRKKIAKEQLEQAVLGVVQSAISLRADVETTCYKLLALQQAETIAKEDLKLLERSLKLAQGRFDAGECGLLDVNLARANVLDVKMELIAIRRDLATTQTALAHKLGLAAGGGEWQLVGELPAGPVPIEDDISLATRAADERLDVQIAADELEAAQQEVRHQYRAIFPSVVLGVEGERTERRAPKSLPFNPVGNVPVSSPSLPSLPANLTQPTTAELQQLGADLGQIHRDRAQTGREFARDYLTDRMNAKRERDFEKKQTIDFLLGPSLQITLPIWDQNRAQIAKARFNAQQKQKACEELLESVMADVRQAAAVVRSAGELAQFFTEESLPLAEKNVGTARRTYEAGEESILALIEAQKSLIRQRQAYVGVLRDQAVALVELEQSLGGRPLPCTVAAPTDSPGPNATALGKKGGDAADVEG